MVTVRRVLPELPELDEERWLRFTGATPDELRWNLGTLRAFAESFENEFLIAASWSGDRLRGIAVGNVESHPLWGRTMRLGLPQSLPRARQRGIWLTDGEPFVEVGAELIAALTEAAREREVQFLFLAYCQPDEVEPRQLGERLGARSITAMVENQIMLAHPRSFEEHVALLSSRDRYSMRRELKRPDKLGYQVVFEQPPSDDTVDRCWEMMRDTYQRKQALFVPREGGNLFRALVRRLPPGTVRITHCSRGDELLGFLWVQQLGGALTMPYIGHLPRPDLYLYPVLLASTLKQALDGGTLQLLLGQTCNDFKARIGCNAYPQVHYFVPCLATRWPETTSYVPLPKAAVAVHSAAR